MSTLSALVGDLAQAREAVAGRLRGIDPADIDALRRAYDAFTDNDPMPDISTRSQIELAGVSCLGILPKGASGDHLILWLHGGGFAMGSSHSHRGLASQVGARARTAVILPDYRLAPEHPCPAAIEDCVGVYRAVLNEGVRPQHVILAGDSAGGCLALATALRLKEAGLQQPAGLMLLAPWVDLQQRGWSHQAKAQRDPLLTTGGLAARARAFLGEASLSVLEADLRGLPPTYIQTGEADILMSDSATLAERLGAAGAPVTLEFWPDMFHVFQARYMMLAQAREAIDRLGQWAREHVNRPA